MLSRKKSFLLNTLIISFLMSGSHTTLGKVSDKWEKMASQPTESQKAADAARAEREKELQAIRDSKKEPASEEKTPVEPMKKPAETTQPTPTKPHVTHTPPATPSPVQKRRTLQEQIALNKQKKAEELHKLQEMNKGKAAAHHAAKPTTNLEKEPAMSPTQKKLMANLEKETVAEPMKKSPNPPPPPKGGHKSVHMSPTQKPTETTHPAVNLAHPPLQMHTEEHEEITLPMPEKGGSKAVTQQADTKKADASKDDLLAQIRKGTALRKTSPQAPSN
jgi:hypothetical protein